MSLQSPSVDSQHALIEYRDVDDTFALQDLNTTYGTYVNGCRIGNAYVRLYPGDVIQFGNTNITYELVTCGESSVSEMNRSDQVELFANTKTTKQTNANLEWCSVERIPLSRRLMSQNYYCQGAPWSWKVVEFRKTIFQAWKVLENSKGHGKSWKMMIMSWNFYYCTEQFCQSDTTSFI